MELFEISDRIDTRLKTFDTGISVDEYEKSLYLTKAQKEIYYELLQNFEQTQIITHDLEPFVVEYSETTSTPGTIIQNSYIFQLPDDIAKLIYESAILSDANPVLDGRVTKVKPIRISETDYKLDSPFRKPDRDNTLRIISGEDKAELLAVTTIGEYRVKYLKEVEPIILEDLPDGLTIDEVSVATNTEFNDEILNKVIDLALRYILVDAGIQAQQQS